MPFAAQPNALAVVDARRDVARDGALLEYPPSSAALRARRLDPAPRAATGRAGLRPDELAEDAPAHLLHATDAPTGRAHRHLGAGLGTVSIAVGARHRDL